MPIERRLAALCLVGLASLAPAAAQAMGSCNGTYSATLLSAMPAPLVVGVTVYDDSPRNLRLAARFKDGLRQAGASLDGKPTVMISVIANQVGGGSGPGGFGSDQDLDSSFNWWGGGVGRQLPDQSQFRGQRQPVAPVTMQMRIEARPTAGSGVAWVAQVNCTRNGNDDESLAGDLGFVIGRSIGKRVDRSPL